MNEPSDSAYLVVYILYMITLLIIFVPISNQLGFELLFLIIALGGGLGVIIISIHESSRLGGLASGFLIVMAIELLEYFLNLSSEFILINLALFFLVPAISMWLAPIFSESISMIRIKWNVRSEFKPRRTASYDRAVLQTAEEYGGVITKSVIVYELNIPLELAEKSLERFRKHGEARRINTGHLTIYDFPSARVHLFQIDNKVIETLFKHIAGISRVELLRVTGLSIESLEEVLQRLEVNGVIIHDKINDEYTLRGALIKQ